MRRYFKHSLPGAAHEPSQRARTLSTKIPMAEFAHQDGEHSSREEEKATGHNLSEAQRECLERCLHALKNAKNDSHTLAALFLITRLCPASQLDKGTLNRIFEAVGLNLPTRLLLTAVRQNKGSGFPTHELLSLGTALLAALSTDPEMASKPQLLATVPILLGIVKNGTVSRQEGVCHTPDQEGFTALDLDCKCDSAETDSAESSAESSAEAPDKSGTQVPKEQPRLPEDSTECKGAASKERPTSSRVDHAMAVDSYQILIAVCESPNGPDQLLSRGAVPALCQAVIKDQTLSKDKGLELLSCILLDKTKEKAWGKHSAELMSLFVKLCKDFCQATYQSRLDMCGQLVKFLPPEGTIDIEEVKKAVGPVWAVLRTMLQARMLPEQIGSALVLSACLLDLCGWELVGPPKICCLLVNRACVEVRMALEQPPGNELSPELQHRISACYRIMEAALEQACNQEELQTSQCSKSSSATLSKQQTSQVLRVLEEAFSAQIYYLQQVDDSRYGDPFVFATFRSLCSWLAEETSCLKEEVTRLLPFLVGYARNHMQQGDGPDQSLAQWMAELSLSDETGEWSGREALRYILPALSHLSAEDAPRKVLLTLETPMLLVDFLAQSWDSLKGSSRVALTTASSMETACCTLLNFTVTEPERIRKDRCFRGLESVLSDALPVLVHKPCFLVLAAHYCTLGLMIKRLKTTPPGSIEASQRRFFSTALRFLRGALDSSSAPGPMKVSRTWEERWDEAAELWRLSLQALGSCVRAQPWITILIREEGWLKNILSKLVQCRSLPDPETQGALEEALCAIAEQCLECRGEIRDMRKSDEGALGSMGALMKYVETK